MLELRFGKAPVRLIVPVTEKLIVSDPLLLPATHSPTAAPDAALLLAAVMASRNVHKPSLAFAASEVLLTVIVEAAGVIVPLSGAALAGSQLVQSETNTTKATQVEMKSSARTRARSKGDNDIARSYVGASLRSREV
jgi:hypothetical protein